MSVTHICKCNALYKSTDSVLLTRVHILMHCINFLNFDSSESCIHMDRGIFESQTISSIEGERCILFSLYDLPLHSYHVWTIV